VGARNAQYQGPASARCEATETHEVISEGRLMPKVYKSMEAAQAQRLIDKFNADIPLHQTGTYTASQTGARQAANMKEQAYLKGQIAYQRQKNRTIYKGNKPTLDAEKQNPPT
jgi:hypothetical protein